MIIPTMRLATPSVPKRKSVYSFSALPGRRSTGASVTASEMSWLTVMGVGS